MLNAISVQEVEEVIFLLEHWLHARRAKAGFEQDLSAEPTEPDSARE